MTTLTKAVLRPQNTRAYRKPGPFVKTGKTLLAALAFTVGLTALTDQAHAVLQPYIVKDDHGGFVRDRLEEIKRLRASGQPVEIRGAVCYSTCTMLLGLPQTCVSPKTVFGFHGPSKRGKALPPQEFERYSRLIASNYPARLKDWYIKTGRYRIEGVHRIRGSEIIRMGVRAC